MWPTRSHQRSPSPGRLRAEAKRPSFPLLAASFASADTLPEEAVRLAFNWLSECGLKVTLVSRGRPPGSFGSKLAERVCTVVQERGASLPEACNVLKIYDPHKQHTAMEGARKRLIALRLPIPKKARMKCLQAQTTDLTGN
jgi:hypothetical protein